MTSPFDRPENPQVEIELEHKDARRINTAPAPKTSSHPYQNLFRAIVVLILVVLGTGTVLYYKLDDAQQAIDNDGQHAHDISEEFAGELQTVQDLLCDLKEGQPQRTASATAGSYCAFTITPTPDTTYPETTISPQNEQPLTENQQIAWQSGCTRGDKWDRAMGVCWFGEPMQPSWYYPGSTTIHTAAPSSTEPSYFPTITSSTVPGMTYYVTPGCDKDDYYDGYHSACWLYGDPHLGVPMAMYDSNGNVVAGTRKYFEPMECQALGGILFQSPDPGWYYCDFGGK